MSPKDPLPIFRPSLYLFPTLSSISVNSERYFRQWKHKHLSLCQPCLKFSQEILIGRYQILDQNKMLYLVLELYLTITGELAVFSVRYSFIKKI